MAKTRSSRMARVHFTAPKDLLERVDQFAQERMEDRSTALRQLIQAGLRSLWEETVVAQYRRGGLTLREAAGRLGIDVWEMQDVLRRHGVPLAGQDEERETLDARELKARVTRVLKS